MQQFPRLVQIDTNRHYSNVMPRISAFGILLVLHLDLALEVYLLLKDFAGVLPSLNLSAAMEQSEQSIQEQRDTVIKDLRVNCPAKPPAVPNCVTCILPATVEDFHLGDGFLRRFGTSVHHEKLMECGIMSIMCIYVLEGCSNAYGRKWRNWKTSIKKWTAPQ